MLAPVRNQSGKMCVPAPLTALSHRKSRVRWRSFILVAARAGPIIKRSTAQVLHPKLVAVVVLSSLVTIKCSTKSRRAACLPSSFLSEAFLVVVAVAAASREDDDDRELLLCHQIINHQLARAKYSIIMRLPMLMDRPVDVPWWRHLSSRIEIISCARPNTADGGNLSPNETCATLLLVYGPLLRSGDNNFCSFP